MPEPRSRSDLLDRVLSASAALVAISALAVSAYQTKIMREQQTMSAWPRVTLSNSGGNENYAWIVTNVGVGPALVRSARLTVDGRALATWSDVFGAVIRDSTAVDSVANASKPVTTSVRRGTVLLPGANVELVRTGAPLAKPLRRFFNDAHTRMQLCYCSVYNDCWMVDSRSDAPDPAEVPRCPDDPAREFRS